MMKHGNEYWKVTALQMDLNRQVQFAIVVDRHNTPKAIDIREFQKGPSNLKGASFEATRKGLRIPIKNEEAFRSALAEVGFKLKELQK
jgi:hypothetical protein